MASEVVLEHIVLRKPGDLISLTLQETDITRRDCIPGAGHRRDIIENVALRLLDRSEVRHDLGRLHDNLAQQQNARTDNLRDDPHHPDDCVNLRQVAAVCTKLLPYIWNGVQSHDIDAAVCQVHHVGGHVVEDHTVAIVQIPLVWVKCRHDDLLAVVQPGKVSRCRRRKDLRHCPLKLVWDVPVIIEEIPASCRHIALTCQLRPDVLLAGVVHDEIKGNRDPGIVAVLCKLLEILHRPELRLHLPEISDRVSAVVLSLRTVQKGHQVQVVHTAVLDVVQSAANALKVAAEQIRVHHHTQKSISLVPVRILLPLPVELLEAALSFGIIVPHRRREPVQRLVILPVE